MPEPRSQLPRLQLQADQPRVDIRLRAGNLFRIYRISIGEDPGATCAASETQASAVLETKPGITSAHLFNEVSVGGGPLCVWITAVNAAGESARVPAQGQ